MNIMLVAEESAGIHLLRALVQDNRHTVTVLTSAPRDAPAAPSLWRVAENLGLSPVPAAYVKDPSFADEIRARRVDLLLNVHSLFLINKEVLKAPLLGCFNMHPGPLPRYAGLNAPSWAIYRGETRYGVTVHRMDPGLDTGPIVDQALFNIDEEDTGLSLTVKCIRHGLPLMLRLVEIAESDPSAIPCIEQDLSKREYFSREVPCQGKVRWSRTAREILNFIRASDYYPFKSPWGYPRATMGDFPVGIVKASRTGRRSDAPVGTVGALQKDGAPVACADGWILISKILVGREYLSPNEILRSGDRLRDG